MTEITYRDNVDHVIQWCRWLLDDMECQLAHATEEGLVADGAAMGVAHVLHGLELAHHVGEFSHDVLATWLRGVAASLENAETPPVLTWAVVEQGHGDGPSTH